MFAEIFSVILEKNNFTQQIQLMKNNLKLAGLGLAATMALAMQSSAQAYDFSFSGLTNESNTTSGTFSIKDSAIPGNLSTSDFEDWEITSVGVGGSFTFYGPGGNFGTPNSSFFTGGGYSENFSANASELTMDDFLIIDTLDGSSSGFTSTFGQDYSTQYSYINSSTAQNQPYNGAYKFSASAPTAVPFGVSTDLSILILGGLYGASRLRKTLAARKQISNQEV